MALIGWHFKSGLISGWRKIRPIYSYKVRRNLSACHSGHWLAKERTNHINQLVSDGWEMHTQYSLLYGPGSSLAINCNVRIDSGAPESKSGDGRMKYYDTPRLLWWALWTIQFIIVGWLNVDVYMNNTYGQTTSPTKRLACLVGNVRKWFARFAFFPRIQSCEGKRRPQPLFHLPPSLPWWLRK